MGAQKDRLSIKDTTPKDSVGMSAGSQMLKDAASAIEDRQKTYGPPTRNFEVIAALWSTYLRSKYGKYHEGAAPVDVAAMMRLVKEARLIETPDHKDSYVDIAGYAACGAEVTAKPELPPHCGCPVLSNPRWLSDGNHYYTDHEADCPAKPGNFGGYDYGRELSDFDAMAYSDSCECPCEQCCENRDWQSSR